MSSVPMVVVAWLAGQMLDGHVHKVQNGGLLVHCGGQVVELVVRRRGERGETGPTAAVEAWLFSEKDAWIPPDGRTLRVREQGSKHEVALTQVRDHFEGKLPIGAEDGPLKLDVTLVYKGHTAHSRLTWTNLDDRERIEDGIEPRRGLLRQRPAPTPPERRPPR